MLIYGYMIIRRALISPVDSALFETGTVLHRWPRGLRRRSGAARLLRSWVRIPPGAWMFFVSVVCCQVEVSATS